MLQQCNNWKILKMIIVAMCVPHIKVAFMIIFKKIIIKVVVVRIRIVHWKTMQRANKLYKVTLIKQKATLCKWNGKSNSNHKNVKTGRKWSNNKNSNYNKESSSVYYCNCNGKCNVQSKLQKLNFCKTSMNCDAKCIMTIKTKNFIKINIIKNKNNNNKNNNNYILIIQ